MKNSACYLALSLILFTVSCKKFDEKGNLITQVIEITLDKNQSYVYTLPDHGSDDPYEITKQASHYLNSCLTTGTSQNEIIYRYIPAKDFTGSDDVVISNADDKNDGHHRGGGGCGIKGNKNEVERIIIIRFNIKQTITNTFVEDDIR